ncbi:MAG: hypothetical protein CM1200mP20_06010 [Pseudomonadota bacterium]|nr:MAG: hypothetical protein CM1200mP20_06010 [Pseudomonadota bacterium]
MFFFLEYDPQRAGALGSPRLLPKGQQRVRARFFYNQVGRIWKNPMPWPGNSKASKFVDLDQRGFAPKWGFASPEEGNTLTKTNRNENSNSWKTRRAHLGWKLI